MHGTVQKGRLPPVVSSLFAIKVAHWPMVLKGVVSGKEKDGEQLDGQKTEIRGQRSEGRGQREQDYRTTDHRTPGGRR